jgi:hypothetical protein
MSMASSKVLMSAIFRRSDNVDVRRWRIQYRAIDLAFARENALLRTQTHTSALHHDETGTKVTDLLSSARVESPEMVPPIGGRGT